MAPAPAHGVLRGRHGTGHVQLAQVEQAELLLVGDHGLLAVAM